MELNILKLASDTSNIKKIDNFTHKALKKNPMCGDYISFKINIKKGVIDDLSYESKSCIYCQASASLISNFFVKKKLNFVIETIKLINKYYENQNIIISGTLKKIFNKKNYKRKDCICLPIKAMSQALKVKKIINPK